jgi:hypothetical protein
MSELDSQARAFLEEFQGQPEEVRRIFIYVVCQTMVCTGMLSFVGACKDPAIGVTLIYKNPDSGEVFEVVKPEMTIEEEHALRAHIAELLQENARAA